MPTKKQLAKKNNKLFKKLEEKFQEEKQNQLEEDVNFSEEDSKEKQIGKKNILNLFPYNDQRVGYFMSNFSPNDIAEFPTIH